MKKPLLWESCWTEECWKHGLGKFVESDPPPELLRRGRMSGHELEVLLGQLHLPGLGEEAAT